MSADAAVPANHLAQENGAGGSADKAPALHHNQTLYIKNLDDHLPKQKLREQLYVAASQYGRVMDVYVGRTKKMRGQAFVSFEDAASAAVAMRSLQGAVFFGKPMVVQFGARASERVMRIDGTLGISKAKKNKVASHSTPKKKDA